MLVSHISEPYPVYDPSWTEQSHWCFITTVELFYRWNFLKRPWKQSNHPSWYFRVVLKLKINKKGSMQMYNGNAWRPQTGDRPWSWKSWRLRGFKEGNEDEISITEGRIQSLTAGLLFLPFLPKHSSHSRASNNSDSRLIYPEYKTKKQKQKNQPQNKTVTKTSMVWNTSPFWPNCSQQLL